MNKQATTPYTVTVDGETYTINACSCAVECGAAIFYSDDPTTGIYGVCRALAKDTWGDITRID